MGWITVKKLRDVPAVDVSAGGAVDLGCGPKKLDGWHGVDMFKYDGVDQIQDLDAESWGLESNTYSYIKAHHIIEHVANIPKFLAEIHRVAKSGAIVEIETPHFSSIDSWQDPTHRWHLSVLWHEPFTVGDSYLDAQTPDFSHTGTYIETRRNLGGWLAGLWIKIKGIRRFERHNMAYRYPLKNMRTLLVVNK